MKLRVMMAILFLGSMSFLPASGKITSKLSDSKATDSAKHLYKYLTDIYGKKVLTGQMENAWNYDCNMLYRVYKDTGKYPAIMGFDFMNYTSLGWNAVNKETERAINYWYGLDWDGNVISDNHGIVTFMWHWRDPEAPKGKTGEFYSDKTDFRIPYNTDTDSWETSSKAYKEIMADLDVVAAELARLQDADVPVLWRPMHEAAGNLGNWPGATAWFWWGAGNKPGSSLSKTDVCGEAYVALWRLMYKYFTETKGLHNLIWVWNGQNEKFYPGSEYVDIVGNDIYETILPGAKNKQVSKSYKSQFESTQKWDETKLVALTECGNLPDVSTDGALWLFFMIWNDGNCDNSGKVTKTTDKNNFWSGDFFNTSEKKKEIYVKNPAAITLDELPDLLNY